MQLQYCMLTNGVPHMGPTLASLLGPPSPITQDVLPLVILHLEKRCVGEQAICFSDLKIRPPIVLQLLELQEYTVSHFKLQNKDQLLFA